MSEEQQKTKRRLPSCGHPMGDITPAEAEESKHMRPYTDTDSTLTASEVCARAPLKVGFVALKGSDIPRKAVLVFADAMEDVLRKHDSVKGDTWTFCDPRFLESKLTEEFQEWQGSHDPRELVDLANLAMMVWTRYHGDLL